MKPKSEKKILEEYLKHKGNPDRIEKRYLWLSNTLFTLSVLFVFFYFSDNLKPAEGGHLLTFAAFTAGTFFGLGIWFSQMGTQTGIFMKHMSTESIEERLQQLQESK
jgi:hypothetical protein